MKKIVVTIVIMCLLVTQMIGYCKAENINSEIEILQEGELPFYYQGEEKTNYKMLKTKEYMIYLNNRNTQTIDSYLSQEEMYHNEEFEKILEYGYPNKSLEQLGANNEFEAYVATQEALYYFIENKNLDLYYAEDPEGQRIIDIIGRIIVRVADNDVELIEPTLEWIEYEEDPNYHYKEYKAKFKKEISRAQIQAIDAEECKLIGENEQEITSLNQNERVKVVVPKDVDQIFFLQLDYKVMQPVIYMASSNTSATQYLVTKLYEKDKDYQLQVESQNWIDVNIYNYKEDTKQPIVGNAFEILDENKNGYIAMLTTDSKGQIKLALRRGKYYLKQVTTNEGELQKELVPFEVKGSEKVIELNVYNTDLKQKEVTTNEKEINVTQENKMITENHSKDILNIHTTNLQTEIINQTNETNLNNVNHFINTINRKNTLNLTKENYYRNQMNEESTKEQILAGENQELQTNREGYQNYIDFIKVGTIDIPNLPIASKQ